MVRCPAYPALLSVTTRLNEKLDCIYLTHDRDQRGRLDSKEWRDASETP